MTGRSLLLLAFLGLALSPLGLEGQGVRGSARTFVSYLQVRDLVLDSVPTAAVPGEGAQRTLTDGTRVTCADDFCRYYRSGDEVGIAPLIQDLRLNAWTGVEGLSAAAHLRARQPLDDGELWPRSSQKLEALSAYLEYRRSFYQVRAGRLWETTALGFYNFDGGSVSLRGPKQIDVSMYGGLSLVRGLNQYHTTDLISDVEPLPPEEKARLLGVHARWAPLPALATAVTYQREKASDAGGLYSERVAGSARVLVGRATVDMELKYDLAGETTNLARVRVTTPLMAGLRGSAEFKKYLPYFDLWTIWGAFSPVGYREGRGRLDWISPDGRFSLRAYGSYRKYGDTETSPTGFGEIDDESWRVAGGGRFTVMENTVVDGEYRFDTGFGSRRSGGDLSIQRFFGGGRFLAVRGTAFESFSEFTVGSGTVMGAGIQGGMPIGPAKAQLNAMFYKHKQNDRPSIMDLNQARLNLILEIPIGSDPGLAGRGTR
jgi:hypothetical protein